MHRARGTLRRDEPSWALPRSKIQNPKCELPHVHGLKEIDVQPITEVVVSYLLGYGIVAAVGYWLAARTALPISTPYAVWVNPAAEDVNAIAA